MQIPSLSIGVKFYCAVETKDADRWVMSHISWFYHLWLMSEVWLMEAKTQFGGLRLKMNSAELWKLQ